MLVQILVTSCLPSGISSSA